MEDNVNVSYTGFETAIALDNYINNFNKFKEMQLKQLEVATEIYTKAIANGFTDEQAFKLCKKAFI